MKSFNVLLFDDFETLDAMGPVEIIGHLSDFQLNYYSLTGTKITSKQAFTIETKPLNSLKASDVFLIPGGMGTRKESKNPELISEITRISALSTFVLSVCTGAALLGQTGLLDSLSATTNKKAFDWVVSTNPHVNWQKNARWCVAEKFYTSSGVSAGMDMTLGFVSDQFGLEKAFEIAQGIEYIWNQAPQNDPFSVR